jgi:hypothetical protein
VRRRTGSVWVSRPSPSSELILTTRRNGSARCDTRPKIFFALVALLYPPRDAPANRLLALTSHFAGPPRLERIGGPAYDRRRSTMNQQAVQQRRPRGLNIAEVAFYSVLVLVIMLLSVYVPARRQARDRTSAPAVGRDLPDVPPRISNRRSSVAVTHVSRSLDRFSACGSCSLVGLIRILDIDI